MNEHTAELGNAGIFSYKTKDKQLCIVLLITKKERHIIQGRHADGSQTHGKMLNITHHQRNANQNHNEVPSHASQDGCYAKVYKQ